LEANDYLYSVSYLYSLSFCRSWLRRRIAARLKWPVPAAQREHIGGLRPSYAFLTDNHTPVESVAGSSRMGRADCYSVLEGVS
jgi:hypothetical protein